MQPDDVTSTRKSRQRQRPTARTWLFRLAAATLVPTLFLLALNFLLFLIGFGYPTKFFLRSHVAEQDVFIENIDFGRSYFPSGIERAPLPVAFPIEKPADEYRIFVLGESAALGFPDSSFSFARILEVMLQERYPDTQFNVLNTSMTAINSHVILPIAGDCAAHQPDLFVVYMGNNEIVGPYGVSGVLGSHSTRLGLIRASIWAKTTRIGQLLSRLTDSFRSGNGQPASWEGMRMFVESQIRDDDPRMKSAYSQFAENLREICEVGRAAGAGVIVSTVGTNVKDCAPFASLPAADLSIADAAACKKLLQEGNQQESLQDNAAALECFQQAIQIDDQRADLHFRLARCLLSAGDSAEARRHFLLARDRDVLRFRADSGINELIRATASGREADGVYLVDAAVAFEKASPDELPGSSLFYEHVHMTFAGNYVLAQAVFEKMQGLLPERVRSRGNETAEPLSEAECMSRLVFTDWNRLTALTMLDKLFRQPPFVDQLYREEREQRVQSEVQELVDRLDATGLDEVFAAYRRALERSGRDVPMRRDFGVLLFSRGELDEATRQFLELKKLLPHHPGPCVLLAQVYAQQGERYQAIAQCDEALRLRPGWPQAIQLRAEVQAALQQPH